MVDGEPVFACNLCNECFDVDTIEKHIEDDHGKTVTRKEWTSCEDSDCGICSECNMKKYEDEPQEGSSQGGVTVRETPGNASRGSNHSMF